MRKFTVGLLSAAALATTILLVRQQKQVETRQAAEAIPATENCSCLAPPRASKG